MGASESTAKTNGTGDDEEKKRQQESGESSTGGGMALAAAGVAAAAGLAAWVAKGDDEEKRKQESGKSPKGGRKADAALAAAGVAAAGVAAWGISRKLSENTEKDGHHHGMESLLVNSGLILEGKRLETWSPPPLGRFKMNTDGACRPYGSNNDNVDRGPSGYGGILRDHHGKWIRGFYEYLGDQTDCLTAEFHGIYNGLLLLDRLGLKEAILETDSTAAVEWITQDANNRRQRRKIINDCWNMIMDCKRLILKNKISIVSCPREANKCADKLASMAIEKRDGYKEIMSVPDKIKSIVDQESKMV